MTAPQYYNEHDPYAAQWLRNLIAAGRLPPGDVDERSIVDIQPEDLNGYDQCHFFAGIGVWPYALGRNDWRERRGVWTGSCPCQPFSAAGRQLGFDDERHLWPAWFHLITQRRPAIILGEQVASALAWLDLVRDDLESAGYAVGAADLCAPGFPVENWEQSAQHEWLLRAIYDCPDPLVAAELLDFAAFASGNLGAHDGDHIRQRLYFVGMADTSSNPSGREPRGFHAQEAPAWEMRHSDRSSAMRGTRVDGLADRSGDGRRKECADGRGGCERDGAQGRAAGYGAGRYAGGMDNGVQPRPQGFARDGGAARGRQEPGRPVAEASVPCGVAKSDVRGRQSQPHQQRAGIQPQPYEAGSAGQQSSDYRTSVGGGRPGSPHERGPDADWLYCRDGKWRPVGPGTFPLAHAPAARVGRLRAYGNALDAETVTAFIAAVRECAP